MDRRTFVKYGSVLPLVSFTGIMPDLLQATAAAASVTDTASTAQRNLVVIQLSGGNDGLNTVIPYDDDHYGRARPTLRLTAERVEKLEAGLGLHPSLKGFANLLRDGRGAIVQGVGYPQPNRSHFESMDLWHTAHGTGALRQTGWLGRWDAQHAAETTAVHVGTDVLPRALWTRGPVPISIASLDSMRLPQRQALGELSDRLSQTSGDANSLLGRLTRQTEAAWRTTDAVAKAQQATGARVDYPGGMLSDRLYAVARLIASEFPARVYYVTLDGFDTHANQANAHQTLLDQLSRSLVAFNQDLEQSGAGRAPRRWSSASSVVGSRRMRAAAPITVRQAPCF